MISANQLYKQSKSDLPFKEWLQETQKKGILQNHEKMFNLIEEGANSNGGSTKETSSTTQTAKTKLGMTNLLGFVGLAILIYGLSRTSAE
jgi:peptidyl-tRNA hydrolase